MCHSRIILHLFAVRVVLLVGYDLLFTSTLPEITNSLRFIILRGVYFCKKWPKYKAVIKYKVKHYQKMAWFILLVKGIIG